MRGAPTFHEGLTRLLAVGNVCGSMSVSEGAKPNRAIVRLLSKAIVVCRVSEITSQVKQNNLM